MDGSVFLRSASASKFITVSVLLVPRLGSWMTSPSVLRVSFHHPLQFSLKFRINTPLGADSRNIFFHSTKNDTLIAVSKEARLQISPSSVNYFARLPAISVYIERTLTKVDRQRRLKQQMKMHKKSRCGPISSARMP